MLAAKITSMTNVAFISYARLKDTYGAVQDFHKALETSLRECFNMDVSIFLDKNMESGVNFSNVIKEQLDSANVLIVLLSPVWLSRPICIAEYQYFKSLQPTKEKKKFIIPLIWRSVDISDTYDDTSKQILEELNKLNQVSWTKLKFDRRYSESIDLQVAIEELADDIKKKIRS
jgi:TIR domain